VDPDLFYVSTPHVAIPKPHDTPILSLSVDAEALSRALTKSLPWYDRWRLYHFPADVAISVDPDREANAHWRHQSNTIPRRRNTGDEDTVLELSSEPSLMASASTNSSATSTSTNNPHAKLLERARQKYPQGLRSARRQAVAAATPTAWNIPSTTATHTTNMHNSNIIDLQNTMSDVTAPTGIVDTTTMDGSQAETSSPNHEKNNLLLLSAVPTEDTDDTQTLQAWLDSTLQSQDDADADEGNKKDTKKAPTTNDVEEDNMEDWLDAQINGL
jgi:hypothetical protein